MLTAQQCQKKYGEPEKETNMKMLYISPGLTINGIIPKRIYCNLDLIAPLEKALGTLIKKGYADELKTWDGCFNIRKKRGAKSPSLHSWGVAIDVNAAWNRFGSKPTLSAGFVQCFKDAGFDWGGDWTTPDGMHFQLSKI